MKRDLELIRQILTDMESHDSSKPLLQVSDSIYVYQIALMKEAGLIDAELITDGRGIPKTAVLFRLTWAGHDFLDAARDNSIWKLAKEKIIKPGASWTFSLLSEWLKQEAKKRIFGDDSAV